MISLKSKGSFSKTKGLLANILKQHQIQSILESYADRCLRELESATPVDTGRTSESWTYDIKVDKNGYNLSFSNTNTTDSGIPIVILLQYGHGTGNGGYVQGRDFINPVILPIFEEIANDIYKEVTGL